ncbi:MAG: V4R domain-containing protein [Chloroflexota bacterium]|mgnify:FL=1
MNVADWKGMPEDATIINALLRQALQAIEEVMGKNGLNVVLKEAGLARYIGNYPPNDLKTGAQAKEYALLNDAIEKFAGRAAKGMLKRIGRASFQWGVKDQAALLGVAGVALKLMPVKARAKFIVNNLAKALMDTNPEACITAAEEDGKLIYTDYSCALCHTRHAENAVCHVYVGSLEEAVKWAAGVEPVVAETHCKAKGDPYCRFEITVNRFA